jgi:hypothetical protein
MGGHLQHNELGLPRVSIRSGVDFILTCLFTMATIWMVTSTVSTPGQRVPAREVCLGHDHELVSESNERSVARFDL